MRRNLRYALSASLLAGVVLFAWSVLPAQEAELSNPADAGRLMFLLQYIGVDYDLAVSGGKIINVFEYDEMVRFSRALLDEFDVLRRHGAPDTIRGELARLHELIRNLRDVTEVRSLVNELVATLFEDLEIASFPLVTPQVQRGAELFASTCAPCHGLQGAGDGFADPDMEPPPASFRKPRMNSLSPHQVFGAMTFGIDGTAMPSHHEAIPDILLWDLAFHVMTLREDFNPTTPRFALSLEDLVRSSNDELLARLRSEGVDATPGEIDFYRRHPPVFTPPQVEARRNPRNVPADGTPDNDPLRVALGLQDAFARVAEQVLPSVPTVTSFVRMKDETRTPAEGWRAAGADLYPGFRRLASGSGFFVTDDGYLLTTLRPLLRPDGEVAEVIDVELSGQRRMLCRLVGADPTLDLAVLQLEVVSRHRPTKTVPVTIGDSATVRIGHWTIAVGDPWGPEKTYAVGTLTAQPGQQCYQEFFGATLLRSSVSIPPEAYGGPLVNIHGEVIGMNVPAAALPGDANPPAGSTLALPIGLTMNLFEALKVTESKRSPWLGFAVLELPTVRQRTAHLPQGERPALPESGVYIDNVFEPGPGSRAGIRPGDSLVSIDGIQIVTPLDFQRGLYLAGIGRTIRLEVFRDGKILNKDVRVEERPPAAAVR